MDSGFRPFLLLRADAPRAELMGLGGTSASSQDAAFERPVALACVPAWRRRGGGLPDPEGDLIA
jgi:hypothetical protein